MESQKAELIRIGKTIREALEGDTDAAGQIRTARATLLHRITVRNATETRRGMLGRALGRHARSWLLLPGTAAALGVLWFWLELPISFQIGAEGTSGRLGDLVEAGGREPLALRFSEGSSILLRSGGRVRVLSAEPSGARVLIESGAMDVSIAHAKPRRARWNFEAGPFHVLVTGTRFTVAWTPPTQTFDLSAQEGSVVVSSTCLAATRSVAGGETVHLSCSAPASSAPSAGAPADLPLISAAPAEASTSPVPPPPLPEASRADDAWRKLLAAGRLADAFNAARGADFGGVLRTANEKELLALGDAARYSGHIGPAVQALTVLRQRFPGSPSASTAAFALGRIAFERRGAYAEAARWFSTYLDEAPNGPLMGDALGRLVEARHRQGDRKGARLDAERYLRRFPEGPYAGEARGILSE